MIQQQLQPFKDQQSPVQISPDYTFTSIPQTKCVYHPKFITHFCKKTECLLPLCETCLEIHSPQHSKLIDTIQNTLTQVYRGYAKRANEIATHQRHDFQQIRSDLHKLIDAIFEDLLRKADQNYQPDLVIEWKNLTSKLEKLKDSHSCMKEAILYFVEPDQGYTHFVFCLQNPSINSLYLLNNLINEVFQKISQKPTLPQTLINLQKQCNQNRLILIIYLSKLFPFINNLLIITSEIPLKQIIYCRFQQ